MGLEGVWRVRDLSATGLLRGFAGVSRVFRRCFAGVSRIHESRFTCFAAVSQQSRIVNLCSRPVALRDLLQFIVQQESRNDDSDRNVTSFIAGHLQGRTDGSAWLQRFHVRQSKGFAVCGATCLSGTSRRATACVPAWLECSFLVGWSREPPQLLVHLQRLAPCMRIR